MSLPIQAIHAHARSAAGLGLPTLLGTTCIGWGERTWGDDDQVIVAHYSPRTDPDGQYFAEFRAQWACYHRNREQAETWAYAIYEAYLPWSGRHSAAPGLTFDASWAADYIEVQYVGVVEALPVNRGAEARLYKAITNLLCTNLHTT